MSNSRISLSTSQIANATIGTTIAIVVLSLIGLHSGVKGQTNGKKGNKYPPAGNTARTGVRTY